jgi:hypothetical protein
MTVSELCMTDGILESFEQSMEKGYCGVHLTQVQPDRLAELSRDQFNSIKGNLDLSDDQDQLL